MLQAIAACMVAEVSFTFTLGFCILGGAPPFELDEAADPYGNPLDSERKSLLDGTLKPLLLLSLLVMHLVHVHCK